MSEIISPCDECRQAALRGGTEPLEEIAISEEGPLFLYRCKICGTLWEANLREAHPISEKVAKTQFHLN